MKQIGLFETKTKLSEICAEVDSTGDEVVITRRGKPWVRIVPLEPDPAPASAWEKREAWIKRKGLGKKPLPLPEGMGENPPIWSA